MPRGRGIYEDEERDHLAGASEKAAGADDSARGSDAASDDTAAGGSSGAVQEPPD